MGIILFIVSFILVAVFTPLGMIYTIGKSCLMLDRDYVQKYFQKLAVSLDQFGGVAMSGLFNVIFIKGKEHIFGNPDETISSVLGKNQKAESLTVAGKALVAVLDWLDEDHAEKSIENLKP